jgi:hypothetical protein
MDEKPRITLDIPDPQDFGLERSDTYTPVRASVVDYGVDWLKCFLAHCPRDDEDRQDYGVWDRLAVSGAQMLAGLLEARGVYYHEDGTRQLVEQIAHYFGAPRADWSPALEAVRTPENSDIVDALVAVSQARLARHKEATQQQAMGDGEGTTLRDRPKPWEF